MANETETTTSTTTSTTPPLTTPILPSPTTTICDNSFAESYDENDDCNKTGKACINNQYF